MDRIEEPKIIGGRLYSSDSESFTIRVVFLRYRYLNLEFRLIQKSEVLGVRDIIWGDEEGQGGYTTFPSLQMRTW